MPGRERAQILKAGGFPLLEVPVVNMVRHRDSQLWGLLEGETPKSPALLYMWLFLIWGIPFATNGKRK